MDSFPKFSLYLLLVLTIVFGIHLTVLNGLNLPLLDHKIILAYVINYSLAIIIYGILFALQNKMTAHLGFLYMGGSFVKFIFFFIFFYPNYKQDGEINSLEFAAFFIPYAISLIFETSGIIKFLKK